MEESCTIEDALDYIKLFPTYLICREKLDQQRKLLLLSGNMQKLAHVEQLLCKLTPWNVSEVQKEARLYEFEARDLKLPRSSDLHAVGDFSQEFLDILKTFTKEIMKQGKISSTDQDKLERESLVALYDIMHHNKKWGRLFFGEKNNKFIRGNQWEVSGFWIIKADGMNFTIICGKSRKEISPPFINITTIQISAGR